MAFTVEDILDCYRRGVFPMAETRDAKSFYLVEPDMRGIIPLDGLHVSKSLRKFMRQGHYKVTANVAFPEVMEGCAEPGKKPERDNTWISENLQMAYEHLHHMGYAHSLEIWDGETLVGGLYGIALGGAFFGESMFSRAVNASKVALVTLTEHLNARGFALLDTQYLTDHLETMGGIEIPQAEYLKLLEQALKVETRFAP
ncbi:MAG: leucyl/phenylalanyl-tRNA--protein transferase [Maricaulaceae bacterium]